MGLLVVLGILAAQDVPRLGYEGSYDSVRLEAQIDWAAVLRTWRIKGVLVCTHAGETTTCLWVENAYPVGILEAVRQPFRTHLKEGERTFSLLRGFGSRMESRHGEDLQFAEVRTWTFVPELKVELDIALAIPDSASLELDYASELDLAAWRSEWVDRLLEPRAVLVSCERVSSPRDCPGRWGSYWPRIGFVARSNEVIASCVQALRGGRVASRGMGRIVLSRYAHEPRTGHYLQMLSPVSRPAVSIGSPDVGSIERAAVSRHGAYLFVHFGVFEACRGCLPVRLTEERPTG